MKDLKIMNNEPSASEGVCMIVIFEKVVCEVCLRSFGQLALAL